MPYRLRTHINYSNDLKIISDLWSKENGEWFIVVNTEYFDVHVCSIRIDHDVESIWEGIVR